MGGELLAQGVELMLVGMGVVLTFLGLLVIAISSMSRLLRRHSAKSAAVAHGANVESTRSAIIAAAIHRYRSKS